VEYINLGKTGLKVSRVGLGTQTFGWNVDLEDSKKLMDTYVSMGGIYFDTADSYNGGESERILGAWLKDRGARDSYVIGTKTFFKTGDGPNDEGASRKHIFTNIEKSLKRLNTDYVDLLQIHCYDRLTPLEETIRALSDLVRQGKVRYVGVSNFTPSAITRFQNIAQSENLPTIADLQLEYSLLVRSPEWELIPVCEEEGIGMLVWSPLAGGWLTGKYRRNKDIPSDSRAGRNDRWDDAKDQRGTEKAYDIIEALVQVSQETGHPVSQVSLRWTMQKAKTAIPLIGARKESQLVENLGALDWVLSDEEMAKLDKVSAIATPSPYDFIERYTRR
jgi:aryl-alcohol dehydrogenase-like predicted oxidoreductase